MRLSLWLTALAVSAVAACSNSSNSNAGYGKKDDVFGDSLSKLYKSMPHGGDLLRSAQRSSFVDRIGELVEYSSSQQSPTVPAPGQDIDVIGFSRRWMSEDDLILLRSRFPMGQGPLAWTTQGSLPLVAGDYAFFHMQTTGVIPFADPAKILQYAIVGDRDGDPANNWQGQGVFDLDFFNDTDLWLQFLKSAGETPRLTRSLIDGTSIVEVDTAARAFACENALLFMIPCDELGDRFFGMPFRGTTFDNIDGNFGSGNDDGWRGDDAPSRTVPLYIPSIEQLVRTLPRVEVQARFVATNRDVLDDLGVDFGPLSDLVGDSTFRDGSVAFGSMGRRATSSRLGGIRERYNVYQEGMPVGGFAGSARPSAVPQTDVSVYSRLFGDRGIPFILSTFNDTRFDVSNSLVNLGVDFNESIDPVRGMVFGSILQQDALKSVLDSLEAATDVAVISQPSITINQRQDAVIQMRNWTNVPIVDFLQPVQDFANTVDPNLQFGEAGITLTVRPHVMADGSISMELRSASGATLRVNNGVTINNETMDVEIPYVDVKDVMTQVMVRNGETIVLGGLMRSGGKGVERGVPWLGDVPIVGELFSSGRFHETKENLLIFITPTIVRD